MQMKKREKKRSESETIKILNAHATVALHICTVIVAIVHKCTIMHKLVWVFFCSNCVKLTTFSILHNYAHVDVVALIFTNFLDLTIITNCIHHRMA